MSTTTIDTYDHAIHDTVASPGAAKRQGVMARVIAARTLQAEAHIRSFLLRHTDRGLADLGFSDEQIREIRATGRIPASYWR